jgi:biofilm PGA synthesis N-glycosyltransferase PgaC
MKEVLTCSYVLVTPARNEEAFIELTIKSVIAQTLCPAKWVIVSDGSTDRTDEIVGRYVEKFPWIELLRMPERSERHFAGKVYSFNAGFERVKDIRFDFIGNLDADISLDAGYFDFLIGKMVADPRLGVTGTPFTEDGKTYDYRFASTDHVSGACQLFRRPCFEAIGGYVPLKEGGVDLVAVTTARMKGWKTQTFTEKSCEHHRKTQSGKYASLPRLFKSGYHDYLMGSAPLWQLLRSLRHLSSPPVLTGGTALLAGYIWAFLSRARKPVSREFIAFRRKEQRRRLVGLFRGTLPARGAH